MDVALGGGVLRAVGAWAAGGGERKQEKLSKLHQKNQRPPSTNLFHKLGCNRPSGFRGRRGRRTYVSNKA